MTLNNFAIIGVWLYLAFGLLFTLLSILLDALVDPSEEGKANRRNVLVFVFVWLFWIPIVCVMGLSLYRERMR